MVPKTFQFVIAMVVSAINERPGRRDAYLREEVRVLKERLTAATGTTRIAFTPDQRRRLAMTGKPLTPMERLACCQIVQPATLLAWFRALAATKYDGSKKRSPGRPRSRTGIRDLVIRLATENPGWGYTKIRDALRGVKAGG